MLDWGDTQEKISLADPIRQANAAATKTRWVKLKDAWQSFDVGLLIADGKVHQQIRRDTTKIPPSPLPSLKKLPHTYWHCVQPT